MYLDIMFSLQCTIVMLNAVMLYESLHLECWFYGCHAYCINLGLNLLEAVLGKLI